MQSWEPHQAIHPTLPTQPNKRLEREMKCPHTPKKTCVVKLCCKVTQQSFSLRYLLTVLVAGGYRCPYWGFSSAAADFVKKLIGP